MNRNVNRVLAIAVVAGMLVLAGCASSAKKPAVSSTVPAAATTSGALGATVGVTAGPQSSYQNRTVYFDFDQSVVKPEGFALLKAQAAYLVAHPDAHVVLQGYCDERGSWSYNIGLGSRRAVAVQHFLELQGVNDSQMQTISYGKAYPADPGHDPAAWAQNRRVVIVFGTTPIPTATP